MLVYSNNTTSDYSWETLPNSTAVPSNINSNITINASDISNCLSDNIIKPEPTESKETKSKLTRNSFWLKVAKFKDGVKQDDYSVIPDINDVRIYNNDAGKPCAVYLDFVDGTTTSAAVRDKDTFNIESGITICLAKKLLDMRTNGCGNSTYNKLVKYAMKRYEANRKYDAMVEQEEADDERRYKKLCEKKQRRKERLATKERERQIEIQKEAIIRALREYQSDDLK